MDAHLKISGLFYKRPVPSVLLLYTDAREIFLVRT